jgi:two-component system, OmpR family, phosphate regulon sensor histidine kinase PhoR
MFGRLGIGAKLGLASALAMLLAGILVERLGSQKLEALMLERTAADLSSELRLLEDMVRGQAEDGARPADWDRAANRLGEIAGGRVTLIAPSGRILGDSALTATEIAQADVESSREEVALAMTHGEGSAVRGTLAGGERLIQAAKRYVGPDSEVAVIRIAAALTDVDRAVARARLFLILGTGAAVAAAIAMSFIGAHLLTRPVRDLTASAHAMSEGNLEVRAPAEGNDEIAKLGRALNRLASERSRTIEELRTDRDLQAGILDGMNEGVLVLDAEERIVLANRAFKAMTLVRDDAIGKSVIEAIRNASLQEALDAGANSEEVVIREVELGGILPKRVLVRVSRLAGRAESAPADRGLIAVFHDVTDLRRLETIRTDFVANVSHELRTPITAISTAAETLLLGALKDPIEASEFVDVIDRHARRLRQLVDDLLDLSKIEAKSFRLKLVELDVIPVISHAARLMADPARRRNVEIRVLQPPELPRARIDRRAVEQVLMNLLDNGIKYAGEGATVTIASRSRGAHIEIAVSDNGPGIPPVHLGRLFERFYRVDAGRSGDLGGTGLGLAIVKHLVELMHGTIEVESQLGKGASFMVRLPCAT